MVRQGRDKPMELPIDSVTADGTAVFSWSMCLRSESELGELAIYLLQESGFHTQTRCLEPGSNDGLLGKAGP